jgi:hypothetical protein
MSMRIASLALAAVVVALAAPAAGASPTELTVRIEGRTQTLFERPLLSEGHDIQASSDTTPRSCDGVNANDPQNVLPGATPTAAAVDAMSAIGETFDGRWFAGFGDYLITRWGPDREGAGESWSVFVNDSLLDVGGCQYELHAGSEVLWSLAAPSHEPVLALYADTASTGAPPLTAQAQLDAPFTVEVDAYRDGGEATPPEAPQRSGSSPFQGAAVSPVQTAANGFETIDGESSETVQTDAQGEATISFTTPGWHRIKASASGAIRSNRLDVCVPPAGASGCGQAPADDGTQPLTPGDEEGDSEAPHGTPEQPSSDGGSSAPAAQAPSLTTTNAPAAGATAAYSLAHAAKHPRTMRIAGLTLTPLDDRSPLLRFAGRWLRITEPSAWLGTVTVGSAGASLSVRLGSGRPVFIVRGVGHSARIQVRGTRSQVLVLTASRSGLSRALIGSDRHRAGTVQFRVLSGTVKIDAVALAR